MNNLESTPFAVLEIFDEEKDELWEFRAFWSSESEMKDRKIKIEMFKDTELQKIVEIFETDGHCKNVLSLKIFLDMVLKKETRETGTVSRAFRQHHLGGNFYRCTIDDLKDL